MDLTGREKAMLDGGEGRAAQKSMQVLVALGKIYGAERMLPVSSVQIAGVSYDNLGDVGLEFLEEMATGDGRTHVLTTLNPAGTVASAFSVSEPSVFWNVQLIGTAAEPCADIARPDMASIDGIYCLILP